MSTELVIIEKLKLDLVPFFTKGDRLDELLDAIKVDIMAHVPDVSTPKGRTLIKNNITAGKKYRLHLEESGKKLSAEYKLIPSAIDATRKKANEFLLRVEAKARERLTEWELTDKAEKKQIADTAAYLIKFAADLEEGYRDNELFDFKIEQAEVDRQAEIKAAADKAATDAKAKAEAEAAEKISQAEREKIAAEQRELAAKQAVIDAENRAAQDAITRLNIEAKAKQDVIDAQERAKYEAEQAEQRRIIAKQQSERNAEIAAKNARDAVLRSQRDEDDRIKAEKKAREADKNHKHTVKVEAMEDFIAAGLSEDSARIAVRSLCFKNIRHCGIEF